MFAYALDLYLHTAKSVRMVAGQGEIAGLGIPVEGLWVGIIDLRVDRVFFGVASPEIETPDGAFIGVNIIGRGTFWDASQI